MSPAETPASISQTMNSPTKPRRPALAKSNQEGAESALTTIAAMLASAYRRLLETESCAVLHTGDAALANSPAESVHGGVK